MVDHDRLLEALAAAERRRVCRHLLTREDAVTLDALAAHLTSELGVVDAGPTIDPGGTAGVDAKLHHQHLPKLANADVLRYDADSTVVEPGPALPAAETVLEALEEVEGATCRSH